MKGEAIRVGGVRLREWTGFAAGAVLCRTHTILHCADELRQAFRSRSHICMSSDSHTVFRPFFQVFQKVLGVFLRDVRDLASGNILSVDCGVLYCVFCYDPIL